MKNKPDGGPAFPDVQFTHNNGDTSFKNNGMTLRDYFAAKAMNGMVDRVLFDQHFEDTFLRGCTTDEERSNSAGNLSKFCAYLAYDMADAMLAERAKI